MLGGVYGVSGPVQVTNIFWYTNGHLCVRLTTASLVSRATDWSNWCPFRKMLSIDLRTSDRQKLFWGIAVTFETVRIKINNEINFMFKTRTSFNKWNQGKNKNGWDSSLLICITHHHETAKCDPSTRCREWRNVSSSIKPLNDHRH